MGYRDRVWRNSEQGRAWQAYERGEARYEATLDVTTASYLQTIEAIKDAGWHSEKRVDHAPIRRTTATPTFGGGHEVLKTVTQMATFYFLRADSARIAPLVDAERRQLLDAVEESARARRAVFEYLVLRPHLSRALATIGLLVPGLILLTVFFMHTESTTESGHLWWKESKTTVDTAGDKLLLLVIGLMLIGAAVLMASSGVRRFRLQVLPATRDDHVGVMNGDDGFWAVVSPAGR